MMKRMGAYYYCMQDVSNWCHSNNVGAKSKHKLQLWFIEKKIALCKLKQYLTTMVKATEYSYRMEGPSNFHYLYPDAEGSKHKSLLRFIKNVCII